MTMMVINICQSIMMTVFNLCPEVFAAILELDQFLKEEEEERREKEEKVSCQILQRGEHNNMCLLNIKRVCTWKIERVLLPILNI